MSFSKQLEHDPVLRRKLIAAIVLGGCLIFVVEIIWDYIESFGLSFAPVLHQKVEWWPFVSKALWMVPKGVLATGFAVYCCWRDEVHGKGQPQKNGDQSQPG